MLKNFNICLNWIHSFFHKDATNSAEIQRAKLLEQQRRNDMRKHELMEKESRLQSQQNELELRISQAKDQTVSVTLYNRIV